MMVCRGDRYAVGSRGQVGKTPLNHWPLEGEFWFRKDQRIRTLRGTACQ
jgi:hypothetical protein